MAKREPLSHHLHLIRQWDYSKNELDPMQITAGSGLLAWWICDLGHSWESRIAYRTAGHGCLFCAGKRVEAGFNDLQTVAPDLVVEWDTEKNQLSPTQVTKGSNKKVWWKCKLGHSWQAKISKRCAGSGCPVCAGKKIVTGYNDLQTRRSDLISECDYERNDILPSQVSACSHTKVWWICKMGHSWSASVNDRPPGSGCPVCAGKQVRVGFNDLYTFRPDLALEWDHEKNNVLPTEVTLMSNKEIWWICKEHHSWNAIVFSRTTGCGCPYCSGNKILVGFNDLETVNPTLAKQWDHSKNKLTPSQVTYGSPQKVWWECEKGHSWKAQINRRSDGTQCPYCVGMMPYKPKCVVE